MTAMVRQVAQELDNRMTAANRLSRPLSGPPPGRDDLSMVVHRRNASAPNDAPTRSSSLRVAAAGCVVAAAALLSGCASATSTLHDAVGQGIAAVETARLVVEQRLDDRTFTTTATATLGDARRELVDASTAVAETDAATATDAAYRDDVLNALGVGLDAVNDAHDALAGVGSLEASVPQLEEAATGLEQLEEPPAASGITGTVGEAR